MKNKIAFIGVIAGLVALLTAPFTSFDVSLKITIFAIACVTTTLNFYLFFKANT